MNIWCKTWTKKEVGFMWALWNKAIAINTWKVKGGQFNQSNLPIVVTKKNPINQTCPL